MVVLGVALLSLARGDELAYETAQFGMSFIKTEASSPWCQLSK